MKKSVSVLFMLLGILFTSCLLISNILATKILAVGPWSAPAGVLIFPVAYIVNDVVTEVWGFGKARLLIWAGFAANVLAVTFFSVGIAVPGASFWDGQDAFVSVLGNTPRIVAASLGAYFFGSFLNAFVMSRMKVLYKGKKFSLRAILSTLVGEAADSLVFIVIAFIGVFPISVLLSMVLVQAVIKTAFEIIILPLTIVVVRRVKRIEEEDAFDTNSSYNIFKISDI